MSKKLPDHIDGLIQYLASTSEKANEDLVLKYFRKTFGNDFTRQEEADRSDGYVPGHFVLELKGNTNDWLSGLFQGIAYKKSLDFGIVIVIAKNFLAVWSLDDLGENLVDEVLKEKGAPSAIGKRLGSKYQKQKAQFLKKSAYQFPSEYLEGIFKGESSVLLKEVQSFEKTLANRKKVRQKVTTKNFTAILKQMSEYFDPTKPIKVVRAFYSMIFGWNETSLLEISARNPSQAALGGEIIENLVPGKRDRFKKFIESHYIHLSENENIDDFFAMYDQALDAVDKNFRIKNGIFFTDLSLSRFAMWFARIHIGDIGKNYLVIDPACGSGNLVTNWRSPMEIRHKVVSEIEPELLYTVEQRMKGDKWHQGKFTVVPRVTENIGLNFLDKSAEKYIEIIQSYLTEKGQRANRPIAFLCNPPYRNDDDQSAESIGYQVDQTILDIVGQDASSERISCFLAQMKRIASIAEDSGLQGDTLLLLFTGTAWLTKRPVYEKIRSEIFGNFEDVSGFFITSNEFFDVGGKFPIAFTVWRYKGSNAGLDSNRPIQLFDLSWLRKIDLLNIDWNDEFQVDKSCNIVINSDKTHKASFGFEVPNIQEWSNFTSLDFKRDRRKSETDAKVAGGLPKKDPRRFKNKKTYGESDALTIGFMDDLTPCRVKRGINNVPWFRLNSPFMDCRKTRCFSGPPDQKGFGATDPAYTKTLFSWFALGRVFSSHGYPMWVNADEMWPIIPPKHLENKLTKLSFAIGYAENECVETVFPAGNPVKNAIESRVENPMSPLESSSFWNREMATFFDKNGTDSEDKLVAAVNRVFDIWKKRTKSPKEIYVEYSRPYFVGDGRLTSGAGLIQIRDYAKELNDEELLSAFEVVSTELKATKDEFNKLLHQKTGFNYFEIDQKKLNSSVISQKPNVVSIKAGTKELTKFDKVLERRRVAASFVINELSNDDNLGAVKLAKILYIADHECDLDLDAKYLKDVAGPMDGRMFYNSKIGLFPDQKSSAIGKIIEKTFKKGGETKVFKKVLPSSDTQKLAENVEDIFGKKSATLKNIVKMFKPLSTDHAEAVATLYACWNDLIISKKNFSDEDIIKNFFKWSTKKKRFNAKDLHKTLTWMRSKKLIPHGKGGLIQSKTSDKGKLDVPF